MTRSGNSSQFQLSEKWKLSSKKESAGGDGGVSTSRQKHGKYGFTRKCGRLVREQRARFYIMRRCVIMLICWTDNQKNRSDQS